MNQKINDGNDNNTIISIQSDGVKTVNKNNEEKKKLLINEHASITILPTNLIFNDGFYFFTFIKK